MQQGNPSSVTISPLRAQRYRGINGKNLTAETDAARRLAGFVPALFANLAIPSSSWYTSAGTVTITTGVADPFRGDRGNYFNKHLLVAR